MMQKTIAICATLDTKGEEASFVADVIRNRGYAPLFLDTGILGEPTVAAGVTRDEIAAAEGTTIKDILARSDKNAAIEAMANGAATVCATRYAEGALHGVIGIGGVQGSVISTRAMQALPIGVPKVMLSAVANGKAVFGPYVGSKDVTIMHSVADILGLNFLTRQVMTAAAGAVTGMADVATASQRSERTTVGMTMAGVTNPTAMAMRELLEAKGFEVVGFHCNGIGAQALEDLAAQGQIDVFLDLSPHDIGGYLRDGLMQCHPDRLLTSGRANVPVVFVPGALDFVLKGPIEDVPKGLLKRSYVRHNPIHTHIRASYDEMREAGRFVAERMSQSDAATKIIIPQKGFSQLNTEGGPIYDPASDAGFLDGVNEALEARTNSIVVSEAPQHVNDPEFAEILAAAIAEVSSANLEAK